ncbi:hypothetical protein [Mycolicibacterium houstonense]|uniref:hypothetical protein n=1 Tax=Mycolicibacterium houstonense TaxID=146021 RepID=UPI003F9E2043
MGGLHAPQFTGNRGLGKYPIVCGDQYDGIQHWTDPRQRTRDIDQDAEYRELGWNIIRVGNDLLSRRPRMIIARTRAALDAAGAPT